MPQRVVRVRIPATTANLGSGFDTLGMALSLYNRMDVRVSDHFHIEVAGEGASHIPADDNNLAYRAMRMLADAAHVHMPPVSIRQNNAIPPSSGLGSSAAAIVGGLIAGNALLGAGFSSQRLLELATELEGHPDNVSPCLYGGLTVSLLQEGHVHCLRALPHKRFAYVAMVPSFGLSTQKARDVLPQSYTRVETVQSVARAVLMYAALRDGQGDMLRDACRDALHQPYRSPLIPDFDTVSALAYDCGALAVYLSGAGPTLLSIYTTEDTEYVQRLQTAFCQHTQPWRTLRLTCCAAGARFLVQ